MAVSVAIFVIFLLYNINSDDDIGKLEPLTYKSQLKKQKAEALWLNHLISSKKKDYRFPIDEIYIKVDLVKKRYNLQPYKLIVDKLDPYQIFCLNQELKRNKVKYFFKKEKNETQLLVFSNDKKRLDSLVKVLKRYQIDAKILKR